MSSHSYYFDNPDFVARYIANGPAAFMLGHSGVLQMAAVLLAEHAPTDGHILVVGAGGGLDTRALAMVGGYWRFTGVDPAVPMLDLARTILGDEIMQRVDLIPGDVQAAPEGPFDGATLILVLGLIPDDGSKLKTLHDIRRRLKPGAAFVLVDRCDAADSPHFDRNLDRYIAYAIHSGVDPDTLKNARASHLANTSMATAARDEALLVQAGFTGIESFYHAMNWHGWVAYA